jgi:hypothetical protein
MDTSSSDNPKAPVKTHALAAGGPPEILAKPRAIASQFFQVQQKLFLISDATNVSISPFLILSHISPCPRKCRLSGIWASGIFLHLLSVLAFAFINFTPLASL